jgi:hypothetical protein
VKQNKNYEKNPDVPHVPIYVVDLADWINGISNVTALDTAACEKWLLQWLWQWLCQWLCQCLSNVCANGCPTYFFQGTGASQETRQATETPANQSASTFGQRPAKQG